MTRFDVPGYRSSTTREFRGKAREQLLSIGTHEEETQGENTVLKNTVFEWQLMADGSFQPASMKEPTVQCGCCQRGRAASCIHPAEAPSNGILLQAQAARCSKEGCKEWVCPRHQRTDLSGARVVCRDHAVSWFWRVLYWIFFQRVEG